MTHNLFAYGTLQLPRILRAVTALELRGESALLPGFRREGVRGTAYPAIVADPAAEVQGRLYRDLPRRALAALDRYEGDEYRREVHTVFVPGSGSALASCYVLLPQLQRRLNGRAWELATFELMHLDTYLRRLHRE